MLQHNEYRAPRLARQAVPGLINLVVLCWIARGVDFLMLDDAWEKKGNTRRIEGRQPKLREFASGKLPGPRVGRLRVSRLIDWDKSGPTIPAAEMLSS